MIRLNQIGKTSQETKRGQAVASFTLNPFSWNDQKFEKKLKTKFEEYIEKKLGKEDHIKEL